ncbi:MAG: hypothetical protein MJ131_09105 [Lachnospiraceae bacterium]|nr:hypothetical protein [Lachnospiraceae bacterium]
MKDEKLQFRDTSAPSKAMAALITGGVSLLMIIIFIVYRGIKEETPKLFAIMATGALVVTLIGFIVSLKCLRQHLASYKIPYAAVIVNGFAFLVYMITYLMGML